MIWASRGSIPFVLSLIHILTDSKKENCERVVSMKRFLLILSLLLALLMLLSACGSKDPAEESIELVAEALFTGPNDFILEHYEEMRSTDIERVDELTEEFRNLFPEVTAVCTESGMDDFVLPAATLQVMEANDGLTSTVKSTKVEVASENSRTSVSYTHLDVYKRQV